MTTTINNEHKKLNVPNLRFPEFQGEWEKCALENLSTEIGDGIHATPLYDDNGTYYFVNGNNISEYGITITPTTQRVTEAEAYRNNANILCSKTILLSINGTIGNVALYKGEPIMLGKSACYINVSTKVNKHYIFHYLMMPKCQFYFTSELTGTTIKNLSLKSVRRTKVSLPNLKEQNRIAQLFDAINERIVTQNKIIEDLKKLKSAIRKKMFSLLKDEYTESFEINQLLDYEQPTAYIVANDEYSTDTSLTPVLTANKGFILGYTDEKFGIYQKGECIIFDDFTMDAKYVSFPFKVKSSAIKILTAKPNVNLRFMFEYLSYWELKSEEHKRHYISEIASLVIELPSKERQSIIASLMTSLNSKLDIEAKTKIRYEEQKRYLLSQMFI